MKKDIHPKYRPVVFRDASNGTLFLTQSTVLTKETVEFTDGKEYPCFDIEHSSASHPFYTGTQQLVDTAGRIERFRKRYGMKKEN